MALPLALSAVTLRTHVLTSDVSQLFPLTTPTHRPHSWTLHGV